MTPENMPAPPTAGGTPPVLRPPDFFLPQSERSTARRSAGEPEIYVSWDGQVYGPSGVDEIITGVRTAYFDKDAMFWFEGRTEWRPVEELEDLFADDTVGLPVAATRHEPPSEPVRPTWPAAGPASSSSGRRRRKSKPGRTNRNSHASRSTRSGRLIVIGAVLLAVAITAGLLLLLSLA